MNLKLKIIKLINGIIYKPTYKQLRTIVEENNFEVLAGWWDVINSWGWPEELAPQPKERKYRFYGRSTQLMEAIESKIGMRFILHYTNVIKDKRMDENEFEDFWNGCYYNDPEAYERYMDSLSKRYDIKVEDLNGL